MTGYSAEEMLGSTRRFLQGPGGNQPALDEVRAALREERDCSVLLRNHRKDGRPFWNKFRVSPVHDERRRLVSEVAAGRGGPVAPRRYHGGVPRHESGRDVVARKVQAVESPLGTPTGRGSVGANRDTRAPIKVLLADDHTMFREGLAGILASHGGMEVVAEVPNDGEALELARDLRPDVVVMQVQLPFGRARETLETMRSFPDPPKVVIVTMLESPRYVRGLAEVGVSAYLLKSDSAEHLVAAVRAAVLDPEGDNVVVGMPLAMLERTTEGTDSVLSARELEVLLLAARGLSNGRIALSLHVAEATVKRHLANVYEKMGVGSRGEAAREALLRDWITIEEVKEPPPGDAGS